MIGICHESDLNIEPKDVGVCHRLPVFRDSKYSNKRVKIKFVKRKHPEALLRNKKSSRIKDFSHLNVHGKVFVCVFFVLTTGISGVSANPCKEKGLLPWRYYSS